MANIVATLPSGIDEVLNVDGIITEAPKGTATVTSHPVEQGANVSDHIRPEADVLPLTLIVSNTPLPVASAAGGAGAAISAGTSAGTLEPGALPVTSRDPKVRAETALTVLNRWKDSGALLTVPTTLGIRTNMAITEVGTTRDAKTGGQPGKTGGLRISLALKHIRIVQNAMTTVVVSKDLRRSPSTPTGTAAKSTPEQQPDVHSFNL